MYLKLSILMALLYLDLNFLHKSDHHVLGRSYRNPVNMRGESYKIGVLDHDSRIMTLPRGSLLPSSRKN